MKHKIYNNEVWFIMGIIAVLMSLSLAASQVVNWARYTSVKSGQHKLRLATTIGPQSLNFSQSFFVTFSQTPQVAIGLIIMDFEPSAGQQGFSIRIHSITRTSFVTELTILSGTTVNQLRYMYFGMIPSANLGVIYSIDQVLSILNTNTASGTREQIDHLSTNTYDLSHQNLFVPFLESWTITPQNGQYSVKVNTAIINSTAFKVIYQSNSTLNAVSVFVIWVDKTVVQADKQQYADYGYSFAQNNQQKAYSFQLPTSSYDFFALMQGANWLNININTRFQADLSPIPPLSMNSFSTYNYISKQMLHFRFRNCITFKYYLQQEQRCYDNCPAGYANQDTFKYCVPCHYSCASCQNDGITCLTCPNNVGRTQNGVTCPCDSGFLDNGFVQCAACDYTCLTCISNSKNCQSCQSTRALVNNVCPCMVGMFDTLRNISTCALCHYTCLTCQKASTFCTSCDQTNHNRILTSANTCLCKSGFSNDASGTNPNCQQNPALVCSTLCQTCSGTSLNCSSCRVSQNRQLLSGSCVCKYGYGGSGNTCSQICGDGIIITAECDDKNTEDGDGCSSKCLVQTGFSCKNNQPPSVCVSNTGYTITYLKATKDLYSNTLTLSFALNPKPPTKSVPSLANIQYKNLVYNFAASNLQVSFTYLQQILPTTNILLQISQIKSTLSFNVKSSNKVAIRPYDQTHYTLFNVENIMVYVLIGLAWLVFLTQIIISKQSLGSSVQMMIGLSMVWIGVMGKSTLFLLFQPITFMYYLFTYNIPFDAGCVLGIINIGFWLNLVAPFALMTVIIIGKFIQKFNTQNHKNFFFFDLLYAALCFNGVIVTYGLARQIVDMNLNTISIISIPFGVIYLIFISLMTLLITRKHQRFPGTASQFIRISHFPLYLGIRYASIFIYTALTNIITLNSLFVIGSTVIISGLIAFRKPYYENIRPILNQLFILFVFSGYLLISQVNVAEWAAFMIITLSIIFVIGNAIMIFFQSRRRKKLSKQIYDQQQADQKSKYSQSGKGRQQQKVQEHAAPDQITNFQMLRNNSAIKQPLFGQNQNSSRKRFFQVFDQQNNKANTPSPPKRMQQFIFYGNPLHQETQK